jgi:cytoskeletal protein CcmA (bactofilin family)
MKVSISRGIASVLGPDLKIEGNIVSAGEVFVLGAFSGTLTARKLTVEKGGTIDGNVEVEVAVINGTFSGHLSATSVSLGRTALVSADITYVAMEMEPGAVHCGLSRHVNSLEAHSANGAAPAPVLELIHSAPGTA